MRGKRIHMEREKAAWDGNRIGKLHRMDQASIACGWVGVKMMGDLGSWGEFS